MIIGVAGPYSADTAEQRQRNLDAMNEAAARLLELGHVPLIGMNAALPVLEKAKVSDKYKGMMDISLAAIGACDALLLLAESPGANKERDLILSKGKPVFRTIEEIPNYSKTSFEPISTPEIGILILGSLPGDKSLELGEYYGHARNRFWKVLATLLAAELPLHYADKKALLLNAKIGVWDVAFRANRKGSLDSAMENEEPNDLIGFLSKHKNVKLIAFNGKKAEALYDRHFERIKEIHYLTLPSTSPANAGINFENLCREWSQILVYRRMSKDFITENDFQ